jgi:hypothetical protein
MIDGMGSAELLGLVVDERIGGCRSRVNPMRWRCVWVRKQRLPVIPGDEAEIVGRMMKSPPGVLGKAREIYERTPSPSVCAGGRCIVMTSGPSGGMP